MQEYVPKFIHSPLMCLVGIQHLLHGCPPPPPYSPPLPSPSPLPVPPVSLSLSLPPSRSYGGE